jgi:hypothetical protein
MCHRTVLARDEAMMKDRLKKVQKILGKPVGH